MNTVAVFYEDTHRALDGLLADLRCEHWKRAASLQLSGEQPSVATVHRLSAASAGVSAAIALGVAQRWRDAGGERQEIAVDALHSLCGLCPLTFQRQSGHAVPMRLDVVRELKAGFYQTRDRKWFFIAGAYAHLRDKAIELLNCPNTVAAITAAVGGRDAGELEETFVQHGATAAAARTREEWEQHPQGRWLLNTPVVEVERIADSPPEPPKPQRRPLDDLRVLDVSHVIAGPGITRSLAEHGADVLRVSSPEHPDSLLQIIDTGLGKRNAYINLHDERDLQTLKALVRRADVFVQSWRPGSMSERGLGAQHVAAMRPGIIYVSVSAYGWEGPWASRKGFDPLGQAVSGVAMSEAQDGRPRLAPTHLLNDYLTAYLGALGVMAALERRATAGGSYHVKVALARASMWVQSLGLQEPPASPVPVDALRPVLRSRPSPFGMLEQLEPVARMSVTPPHWALPPAPLGSSAPCWAT